MTLDGAARGRRMHNSDPEAGSGRRNHGRLIFLHGGSTQDPPDYQPRRGGAMPAETSKVGKRGTVVIPASLRRRFGITEGSLVIVEERADGVLIRPAAAFPLEMYSPERQVEFLLSNAVGPKDYARAKEAVRKMGLDFQKIPHYKLVRS